MSFFEEYGAFKRMFRDSQIVLYNEICRCIEYRYREGCLYTIQCRKLGLFSSRDMFKGMEYTWYIFDHFNKTTFVTLMMLPCTIDLILKKKQQKKKQKKNKKKRVYLKRKALKSRFNPRQSMGIILFQAQIILTVAPLNVYSNNF